MRRHEDMLDGRGGCFKDKILQDASGKWMKNELLTRIKCEQEKVKFALALGVESLRCGTRSQT